MDNEIRPVPGNSHPPLTRPGGIDIDSPKTTARPVRAQVTRHLRTVSIVTAVSLGLVLGACTSEDDTALGNQPFPGSSGESSGERSTLFAPYVYVDTAGRPTLSEAADETGSKSFVLAFILAGPGECTPSWNGVRPVDDQRLATEVAQLRQRGGDVIVSTGGASGPYLENACSSADDLAAAYKSALDAVGSNHLDVDVEDEIPVGMVNDALAKLQQDRRTTVTYTLQVENAEEGLTASAMDVLGDARDHGLQIIVNAMVMNFGYTGGWGPAMVSAAESAVRQMSEIWPDEDPASLRGRFGITTMIGRNDSGMVTTLDDARTLADYVRSNRLAYVGFWSMARDNGDCPGKKEITDACSGVTQERYEFTGMFKNVAVERNSTSFRSEDK
ncbi:MAG: glycosyl hydrolase [Pseudonocardiaceae bacterium]